MKLELQYRCHLSFKQAARSGFKVRTMRSAAERPVRSLNLYRKAGSAAHVARSGRKLKQARAKGTSIAGYPHTTCKSLRLARQTTTAIEEYFLIGPASRPPDLPIVISSGMAAPPQAHAPPLRVHVPWTPSNSYLKETPYIAEAVV